MTPLALGSILLLLLTACASGAGSGSNEQVQDPAKTAAADKPVEATTAVQDGATIRESGFGQAGDYTWVTALVENTGLVGEFATVVFNLYDEGGTLLSTAEQVEGFTAAEGTTAIGTLVETAGVVVARVDASLSVSDYGMNTQPIEQLPAVTGQLAADGTWTFELQNTTDDDWTDLRVGIICRSTEGTIVGGASAFPSLVPAGGPYLITDPIGQIVGETSCTAYPQLQFPMP